MLFTDYKNQYLMSGRQHVCSLESANQCVLFPAIITFYVLSEAAALLKLYGGQSKFRL